MGGWGGEGQEKESMRAMLVTCGVSLPTSSGILCLGIYTCHLAEGRFHGKKTGGKASRRPGEQCNAYKSTSRETSEGGKVKRSHNT